MKGDMVLGFTRFDVEATEERAEAFVDRVIVPHPDEQIVGWVPLPRTETCECRHESPVVAVVEVKLGRARTNPARVCDATLARIRSIFPADELIEREVLAA